MPGGGARPNSGPKKGTRQMRKLIASPAAIRTLQDEASRPRGAKRCKDILAEFAILCAGIASRYQPDVPKEGPVVWAPGHKEDFIEFAKLAAYFAAKGAPFQDPTFKSVMVAVDSPNQNQPGDAAKVINLRIFEDTGTADGLKEVLEHRDVIGDDDGDA